MAHFKTSDVKSNKCITRIYSQQVSSYSDSIASPSFLTYNSEIYHQFSQYSFRETLPRLRHSRFIVCHNYNSEATRKESERSCMKGNVYRQTEARYGAACNELTVIIMHRERVHDRGPIIKCRGVFKSR